MERASSKKAYSTTRTATATTTTCSTSRTGSLWRDISVICPPPPPYVCPRYFSDDWLNGAAGMGDAYKFVYLGPRGTVTPLHADVLNSYSWSSNVCGRKLWYLVPPEFTHLLYDAFGTRLAPHLHSDLDYSGDLGPALYPGLAGARRRAYRVVQETGETVFVPSGWHHTVENLAPTLSINHNWINGTNIAWSWDRVRSELSHVAESVIMHPHAPIVETFEREQNDVAEALKGDDLLLLWLVVSKKVGMILDGSEKAGNGRRDINGIGTNTDKGEDTEVGGPCFDLRSALKVLESLCALLSSYGKDGLIEKSFELADVYHLVFRIQDYLTVK